MTAATAEPQTRSVAERADELLARATDLYDRGVGWAEYDSALFGPDGVASLFPTQAGREEYVSTAQHRQIRELGRKLRDDERDALPSGKFLLRLPRTLHAELLDEAGREGVSVNQLCVAKLSVPLGGRVERI